MPVYPSVNKQYHEKRCSRRENFQLSSVRANEQKKDPGLRTGYRIFGRIFVGENNSHTHTHCGRQLKGLIAQEEGGGFALL